MRRIQHMLDSLFYRKSRKKKIDHFTCTQDIRQRRWFYLFHIIDAVYT